MVCGVLVWTLLIDPGSHKRLTVGGRVALAAAMFAAGQILTDVLVFSFTPLYPWYHGAYGISALADQQIAGLVMMVEQLLTLGICVALLLRPRWQPRAPSRDRMSPYAFGFEPLFLVLAVAAAVALLARRAPRSALGLAPRLVRRGSLPHRRRAQLAAREPRGALPPARAPASERAHRRRRAAPRAARPDAGDAGRARPPRRRPPAVALDPPRLAPRVVRHAPRAVLQLGAAHRLGAQHRARDPHHRRPALLVADRERPPHARRRVSRTSPPRSSARRSSASRTSSRAIRTTRTTSTCRGSGDCRRRATRASAGSS